MAVCDYCSQEMSSDKTTSCPSNQTVRFPDGQTKAAAIPFAAQEGERCHDCNVEDGGFHHPGCDMERCPLCSGQIISCGCGE